MTEKVSETAEKVSDRVSGEPTGKFEVSQDAKGEFRWRLQDTNNKIIADSARATRRRSRVLQGSRDVRGALKNPTFNDKTKQTMRVLSL